MTELRTFPEPTQEQLIAFIFHTNRIERIPLNKDIIEKTIMKKESNPYVIGHLKAITLVLDIAKDPNLIPDKIVNIFELEQKLPWITRLHRNIMKPIAEFGTIMLDKDYIQPHEVGTYRSSQKSIFRENTNTTVNMPDPLFIRELLFQWATNLTIFNNSMKNTINRGIYSPDDVEQLIQKAYEANLTISCIKPFTDGSNRLGRLIENLLRLNWGLPWKIITTDQKDSLLNDLRSFQQKYHSV